MSTKLDPKEVLQYLNELGYYNITAQQLKEFMRDLKKLMKYDIEKADKENIEKKPCSQKLAPQRYYETPCSQINYDCTKQYTSVKQLPEKHYQKTCSDINYRCAERPYVTEPVDLLFSNLHSASTASSRAKSAVLTPNIPGVSFAKPRRTTAQDGHSEESSIYSGSVDSSSQTQSRLSNLRSKSAGPNLYRPKSFIRPAIPLYSSKSDPVSLYHQYQAEWKKQKLPGEDYHKDLRWAIREKMLSAPKIQPVVTSTRTVRSKKRL